jgi:hypothetical protein
MIESKNEQEVNKREIGKIHLHLFYKSLKSFFFFIIVHYQPVKAIYLMKTVMMMTMMNMYLVDQAM